MRRSIRLQRFARQCRWFDVPGWLVTGLLVAGWLVFSGASRRSAAEEKQAVDKLPEAAAKRVDYGRDIEPLWRRSCYSCHGPGEPAAVVVRARGRRRAAGAGTGGGALPSGGGPHP